MRAAFRLYRILLALALGTVSFSLGALAVTRPVEIAESSALLLTLALAEAALGGVALLNRKVSALVLMAASAVGAAFYVSVEPLISMGLLLFAVIEIVALMRLKPFHDQA